MNGDKRVQLLETWARGIVNAAHAGALTGGQPIRILGVETIRGPRAGALEIKAGLDAGRLLKVLSDNDYALHRQFIPWDFRGEPSVFMAGRHVRLEAGWPPSLSEQDIKLGDLAARPKGNGRWAVGRNEYGQVVVAGLNLDRTPHWLVSGATGAGKTVALRSAVTQLAADSDNQLILIDGKRGASFAGYKLRAMVGPVATNPQDWQAALLWASNELTRRYESGSSTRLIVVVDEVQEVILDQVVAEAVRRLTTLGRDACVHCLLATQHPVIAALGGPTVTRNMTGRLALRVSDFEASRVAIGGAAPRADHLLGRGDAYAVAPTATHRVQVAYTTKQDLEAVAGAPTMEEWPEVSAESLGQVPGAGRPSPWPEPAELGVAMAAAWTRRGRPWLQEMVENAGLQRPGSIRADRLLALARGTLTWLKQNEWQFRVTQ
jgi:hypothetical protein